MWYTTTDGEWKKYTDVEKRLMSHHFRKNGLSASDFSRIDYLETKYNMQGIYSWAHTCDNCRRGFCYDIPLSELKCPRMRCKGEPITITPLNDNGDTYQHDYDDPVVVSMENE